MPLSTSFPRPLSGGPRSGRSVGRGPVLLIGAFALLSGSCAYNPWRGLDEIYKDRPPLSPAEVSSLVREGDRLFEPDARTVARSFEALARFEKAIAADRTNPAWLLKGARACAWLARRLSTSAGRRKIARKGVELARAAVKTWSSEPSAHFYMAVNMGLFTKEMPLGALDRIKQMQEAALEVVKLEEKFEEAAGHRYLGLLYAKAPGFPVSIGDTDAAFHHLRRAVELYPDSTENRLALAEVLLGEGRARDAAIHLNRARTLAGRLPEGTRRREFEEEIRRLEKKLKDG